MVAKIKKKGKKRLLKPSTLKFPLKKYLNKTFGISQSMFTDYLLCDIRLLFGLNRLNKPGKEENFFYGNIVHDVLDRCYSFYDEAPGELEVETEMNDYLDECKERGELDWITDTKLEYYKAITVVVLTKYFELYTSDYTFDFQEVEGKFDVIWKGFRLIGKRDGKFFSGRGKKRKKSLFEHKTKGQIGEENIELKLPLDFQNKYYMFADYLETGEWCDNVLYNIIRRPQIKPWQNESLPKFSVRLAKDIDLRPDFYFKRWVAEYSKKQMEDFQIELYEKLQHMDKLVKGERIPLHNESSCLGSFPCEFLKACSGDSLEGYVKRKHISPELT